MYLFINDLPGFLIVRLIHGLCVGMATSAVITTSTYHLAKSRYGEANGYMMTSITLAIALGPFLAGRLYDSVGPRGCFIAAIALSGCMWICLILTKTDYNKVLSEDREQERPAGAISMFFVVYAAVLIISRPAAGKLQDRKGDSSVIYPCVIMQFLSRLILGLWSNVFGVLISAVLCAAGYGSATSAMNTIMTRGLPAARKSYAVNTYWVSCDLANVLGPVILGAAMDGLGVRYMYIIAAAVSLLALVFYRLRFRAAD